MVVTIPAQQTVLMVARLGAGPSLSDGVEAGAVVSASVQGILQGSLELKTRVRNRPKIYYVAIDGCGRGYLDLNRKGTAFVDGTGERLTPRASSFASRGARMAGASSVLPAVTDPNHAAALTGSGAGTLGLFAVGVQYMGKDARGRAVRALSSRSLLRWGLDGQRVQSVYDINKDPASGGSPSTYNAIISGKNWVTTLFKDNAVDVSVDGQGYPAYVPAPQPYRLGDPPSDDDPKQDREGTNLGPRAILHRYSAEARLMGNFPNDFPEDRWVAEATVRVIQAEDPDVLYVVLADVDSAQHTFGAADRPEEWVDPGTPNVLWDDVNIYNPMANRDPVLDVVHEADWDFGLIADVLDSRHTLDRSFVTLLSDHGLFTEMNTAATALDPGKILLDNGIGASDVEWIANRGETGFIVLKDPTKRSRIESILQAYEALDPVQGVMVKPFIVINRDEMDSGIDDVEGRFAGDGVPGNRRGDLYSEWNIDAPVTDNSKVKWPDLFYFNRTRLQTVLNQGRLDAKKVFGMPFNGNHGSRNSADVVLIMSGPGIQPGVHASPASLMDIAPTLYRLLGVHAPGNVDGRVLDEILAR
jgi:arylsulfatase A-like enzyme